MQRNLYEFKISRHVENLYEFEISRNQMLSRAVQNLLIALFITWSVTGSLSGSMDGKLGICRINFNCTSTD